MKYILFFLLVLPNIFCYTIGRDYKENYGTVMIKRNHDVKHNQFKLSNPHKGYLKKHHSSGTLHSDGFRLKRLQLQHLSENLILADELCSEQSHEARAKKFYNLLSQYKTEPLRNITIPDKLTGLNKEIETVRCIGPEACRDIFTPLNSFYTCKKHEEQLEIPCSFAKFETRRICHVPVTTKCICDYYSE